MSTTWQHQIAQIQDWQIATGHTGAPPRCVNARLAHWAQWAARQARHNPSLAAEMDALGVPVERDKPVERYRAEAHRKRTGDTTIRTIPAQHKPARNSEAPH